MPNVNRGVAFTVTPFLTNSQRASPPTNLTTFANLPTGNDIPIGASAYTSDQGPCWWSGSAWQTVSTAGLPNNLTYSAFIALYAAASYTGRAAYTTDEGIIVSNGTVWYTGGLRLLTAPDATSISPVAGYDRVSQINSQAGGTLTINNPTGFYLDTQQLLFRITSTNVQTYSWGNMSHGSTASPLPTATSGSSARDYVGFIYNTATTQFDCVASLPGY